MIKSDELELFEYLSRQPRFRDWLEDKFNTEVQFLVQSVDADQLRRAQGRSGLLQSMLKLLDEAKGAKR